jgi:O-antigen/teichoic acid export membrane protein/O-antigen ligase
MAADQAATASGWRSAANRSLGGSLFASGALQLIVIVSGVLVARSLGPEDRGHLALLAVVSAVCSLIGTLGLPLAATYYIAHDRSHARQIASSLLRPGVILAVATLGVQAAVLAVLVVDEPGRVKAAALISLPLVPGILAFSFGTAILQGQQRFAAFNILRILPTAAYVVGVAVVFVLHTADLVNVMAIWSTAYFFGGFLALGVAVSGLPTDPASGPAPSRSRMTKFGLKSLFGSISPIDALRLDQVVVGLFLAPAALGLYVVAQAFTNLPRVVAASVGMVGYPEVASQPDRAAARRAMWRYFLLGIVLSALAVGALEVLAGKLVTLFFGSDFSDATSIARILLFGGLFMAARRVLTDGVNGLGHPGLGTVAEVASWVLLVPAVAILLPRYGVDGVALALTFAWAGSLLLLLALVGVGDARLAAAWRSSRYLVSRVATPTRPRFGMSHQLIGLAVAVAAASAAAVAVALLPSFAALLAIAFLAAALCFAFGRSALARKTHSLRVRLAGARSQRDDGDEASPRSDAEFRLARRLYYLGLVFLALLTFRVGGQVTYSDILFLFSFLFACAALVVARRRVPMMLPFLLLIGMALFSFGGLLSTFYSLEAFKSTAVIVRLIFLTVFWFWLGTVVLDRREHVTRAVTIWVASAAVCGGAGALQLLVGDALPMTGMLHFGRATGFTAQPNDLGGLTAVAFVPALMLAARRRITVPQRLFSYLLLLLVGGGLILSGSVGALFAVAAAMFVWFAFQRTSIESIVVFAAIGVCVVGVVTVQAVRGAPTPLERIDKVTSSSSTSEGAGTLDSRITIYRVAAAEIKEHPFVGVGLDLVSVTKPFGVVSYEYDVHNLVIGTWYKAGLLGLAGILIAFLAVLRTGWLAILQSKSEAEQMLAVALLCSVVAFVAFAMSEPVLFSRYGWISAALLLALRGVQVRGFGFVRERSYEEPAQRAVLAPVRP